MRFCGVLFFFILSIQAQAYPTFIRHEYASCTACHLSPRGGGLLSEYGEGIAGAMSAFPQDYKGPPKAGFFRTISANGRITHGAEFRSMALLKEGKSLSVFPMQLDYLGSGKIVDRFRMEVTGGVQVRRDSTGGARISGTLSDNLVLRRWVGVYSPSDTDEITLGRDWLSVGLNLDDHTLLMRTKNRRALLDTNTVLKWDRWSDDGLITPFVFGPSGEENEKNAEYGFGVRAERFLKSRYSLGVSAVFGRSKAISRQFFSFFSRISPWEPLAILFEYDFTQRQIRSPGSGSFGQHVGYLRATYEFLEWLDAGPVIEYSSRQAPFYEQMFTAGGSAYFRVIRQVTLIASAKSTQISGGGGEKFVFAQVFCHL